MIDSEHIKWHSLEIEAVFRRVGSSEEGLDITESKKRLKEYGFNILQQKHQKLFLAFFCDSSEIPLFMCSCCLLY